MYVEYDLGIAIFSKLSDLEKVYSSAIFRGSEYT